MFNKKSVVHEKLPRATCAPSLWRGAGFGDELHSWELDRIACPLSQSSLLFCAPLSRRAGSIVWFELHG